MTKIIKNDAWANIIMISIDAGLVDDIAAGTMHKITHEQREILIINKDGTFYAINDTCTHAGSSLSEGKLQDGIITCGWHGAEFDCSNGKLKKFPAKINDLGFYKTEIKDGHVFVNLEE